MSILLLDSQLYMYMYIYACLRSLIYCVYIAAVIMGNKSAPLKGVIFLGYNMEINLDNDAVKTQGDYHSTANKKIGRAHV